MNGKQLRDEAIHQVNHAAERHWKFLAMAALMELAQSRAEFTSDDVRETLKRNHPAAHTHEPRAMGAIMKHAQTHGIIEPTDRFINSTIASKHASPTRVWRSLIQSQLI